MAQLSTVVEQKTTWWSAQARGAKRIYNYNCRCLDCGTLQVSDQVVGYGRRNGGSRPGGTSWPFPGRRWPETSPGEMPWGGARRRGRGRRTSKTAWTATPLLSSLRFPSASGQSCLALCLSPAFLSTSTRLPTNLFLGLSWAGLGRTV